MEPIIRVEGIAAPLPIDNVDTDAIIPSRETQSVARTGYAEKLFANWRYEPGTRIVNPGFVLNNKPFDKASFLVAGANFGCGSSREAAVWSLQQFGIRCVIAGSYGAIFYNNCVRNGLLPVVLGREDVSAILEYISDNASSPVLVLDLQACHLSAGARRFSFDVDSRDRELLLNGVDEVELILRKRPLIEGFREADRQRRPWLYQPGERS